MSRTVRTLACALALAVPTLSGCLASHSETEPSLIMKSKDEKGDKPDRGERRRREDEGEANTASAENDGGNNAEAA